MATTNGQNRIADRWLRSGLVCACKSDTPPAMLDWQANKPKPDVHTQIAALRRFLDRLPERSDIRSRLAGLYLHLGDYDKADAVLGEHAGPHNGDALLCLAKLARRRGLASAAEEHLLAAQKAGSKEAVTELAKLFAEGGRHEAAISLCQGLLAQCPGDFETAVVLCKSLMATRDDDGLGEWGAGCLSPGQWNALAPTALAYANGAQLPRDIIAPQSNITRVNSLLGTPALDQLREHLMTHKSRSSLPTSNAGRGGGWRISQLLELGIPGAEALFDRIKHVVEQRVQEVGVRAPKLAGHNVAEKLVLETWANIFAGDGYEDWHCHPSGWLSGVFYVDVPDLAEGSDQAGQIEFGPLALSAQNDLKAWPKKIIRPQKDMLLLFPSYFGHRTYPTQSPHPRISIAFDVVPQSRH